jgi:hypothetical protein
VSLIKLILARCNIGDDGLVAIAGDLRLSKCLDYLCVADCSLTFHSMSMVADVVKFQFAIRSSTKWIETLRQDGDEMPPTSQANAAKRIDLCKNRLGNTGAILLSEALREPIGLRAIDLQWNHIGNQGGLALLKLVQENQDLVLLDVRNNEIDDTIVQQIRYQLLKNANSFLRACGIHEKIGDLSELPVVLKVGHKR